MWNWRPLLSQFLLWTNCAPVSSNRTWWWMMRREHPPWNRGSSRLMMRVGIRGWGTSSNVSVRTQLLHRQRFASFCTVQDRRTRIKESQFKNFVCAIEAKESTHRFLCVQFCVCFPLFICTICVQFSHSFILSDFLYFFHTPIHLVCNFVSLFTPTTILCFPPPFIQLNIGETCTCSHRNARNAGSFGNKQRLKIGQPRGYRMHSAIWHFTIKLAQELFKTRFSLFIPWATWFSPMQSKIKCAPLTIAQLPGMQLEPHGVEAKRLMLSRIYVRWLAMGHYLPGHKYTSKLIGTQVLF